MTDTAHHQPPGDTPDADVKASMAELVSDVPQPLLDQIAKNVNTRLRRLGVPVVAPAAAPGDVHNRTFTPARIFDPNPDGRTYGVHVTSLAFVMEGRATSTLALLAEHWDTPGRLTFAGELTVLADLGSVRKHGRPMQFDFIETVNDLLADADDLFPDEVDDQGPDEPPTSAEMLRSQSLAWLERVPAREAGFTTPDAEMIVQAIDGLTAAVLYGADVAAAAAREARNARRGL